MAWRSKYRALVWLLVDDDALRDHRARRQVLAFGRELERLADLQQTSRRGRSDRK
jgi:hypothetical protein